MEVIAGFYACWHGPEGLVEIARETHRLANLAAASLEAGGADVINDAWFDTLTVSVPGRAEAVVPAARDECINLGLVDDDRVRIAFDETSDD